ncbi:MAG: type V CRISPR-associated protein Cas4 [Candidatus Gracilibacteria bacterium]|nr:type V CRISPR-associated protein Cas4 [Candidatus Gracilibacteria bacterium]
MESYIKLSTLNDFIFCPKSIYYHNLYDNYDKSMYQEEVQIAGTIAHESIDQKSYSSRKDILQGLDVYSEEWGIAGKIDLFFMREGKLVERKNKIERIYQGYKYQLWGQMICLEEMGYKVNHLEFYSMKDNKTHKVYKPSIDELYKFKELIKRYKSFDLLEKKWSQNTQKCLKCIYKELCDYYIGEVYPQLSLFE